MSTRQETHGQPPANRDAAIVRKPVLGPIVAIVAGRFEAKVLEGYECHKPTEWIKSPQPAGTHR